MESFLPEPGDRDAELLMGTEARRVVFGHTHLAFMREGPAGIELVNPGSVGIPLDGDRRSAYALVGEDGRVEQRRVDYDYAASAAELRARFGEAGRDPSTAHRAGPLRRHLKNRFQCYGPAIRLPSVRAPRDREFFDLFEEAGNNILRAAGLLEEMLRDFPERNELAREILNLRVGG